MQCTAAFNLKEIKCATSILKKKQQCSLTESRKPSTVSIFCRLPSNIKKGSARTFYSDEGDFGAVCIVGLGKKNQDVDELEEINTGKEDVRLAAAAGASLLQSVGVKSISIEDLGDAEAAAEGATLQLWTYQELKNEEKQKKRPTVTYYSTDQGKNESSKWDVGVINANAQNLARRLMDSPANLMTPTIFANNATEVFRPFKNVEVIAREQAWAKAQKMESFLSVSRGSAEPPVFLEIHYQGGEPSAQPVALVGKGVTFDTGGISIKPAGAMDQMRADMGGGACVLATIQAAASLSLPLNIVGLIPLCENMPSGTATKPGDVVRARNGKTIQVDNTDAEGRLILADALCYAQDFNPNFILDIATLTGAMRVALASGATGVFTNSTELWSQLRAAGTYTGDRVWRFPLWQCYTKQMTDYPSVDVNNVGKGKGGGACTAAAFLKEFVLPKKKWLHLDMAGVMGPTDDIPYIAKGMTGRPTRTLVKFLQTVSQ